MSPLDEHVQEYLRLRRALGYKLEHHERILPALIAHVRAAGASTITSQLAIDWAMPGRYQPPDTLLPFLEAL